MPTKHYYIFNGSTPITNLNRQTWDSLRIGKDNPAFQFETTVEEYESNCAKRQDCRAVAKVIRNLIRLIDQNVSSVVSLGSGKGVVEWHLKRLLPSLPLICTDYAEVGVESLRRLFQACDEVMIFDMLNCDYGMFDNDAVLLMNRVSTEFTPSEWRFIFQSCKAAGINHILFIPTELASIRLKALETLRHYLRRILKRRDTFCGWLYSKREIESLMSVSYTVEECAKMKNSAVYLLKRKD